MPGCRASRRLLKDASERDVPPTVLGEASFTMNARDFVQADKLLSGFSDRNRHEGFLEFAGAHRVTVDQRLPLFKE
jgi:hypothetical protein